MKKAAEDSNLNFPRFPIWGVFGWGGEGRRETTFYKCLGIFYKQHFPQALVNKSLYLSRSEMNNVLFISWFTPSIHMTCIHFWKLHQKPVFCTNWYLRFRVNTSILLEGLWVVWVLSWRWLLCYRTVRGFSNICESQCVPSNGIVF